MYPGPQASAAVLVIGTVLAAALGFGFVAFCSGHQFPVPSAQAAPARTSSHTEIYLSGSAGDSVYLPLFTVKKRRSETSQGIVPLPASEFLTGAGSGLSEPSGHNAGILFAASSDPVPAYGILDTTRKYGSPPGTAGSAYTGTGKSADQEVSRSLQTLEPIPVPEKIAASAGSACTLSALAFAVLAAIAVPCGKIAFRNRSGMDLIRLFSRSRSLPRISRLPRFFFPAAGIWQPCTKPQFPDLLPGRGWMI